MCEEVYKMTAEEERLARRSIAYLKEHGLIMVWAWKLNGQPPEDVHDYLGKLLDYAFPPDEETLVDLIIGLIEVDLPLAEGEEPVSGYARKMWARRSGK
jgi:hypothetical protein